MSALSIREASIIHLGAYALSAAANAAPVDSAAAPAVPVTARFVLDMARRSPQVRASVLAAGEAAATAWPKNPQNVLATIAVQQTRGREVRALNAAAAAVMAVEAFGHAAQRGDPLARERVQGSLMEAVEAIDELPGALQARRGQFVSWQADLIASALHHEVSAETVQEWVQTAEREYLRVLRDRRLSNYLAPDPGEFGPS